MMFNVFCAFNTNKLFKYVQLQINYNISKTMSHRVISNGFCKIG